MTPVRKADLPRFTPGQLEALWKALADTEKGLTGTEIGSILDQCRIRDLQPEATKWRRLYAALGQRMNKDQHSNSTLNFITHALDPARYGGKRESFEERRRDVNMPLAFVGLEFGPDGKFHKVGKASTLDEAERRAQHLRSELGDRNVHPDVLSFCNAELVADNYFHAVLEATKSVAAKLRTLSGLTMDGSELVDQALLGQAPSIAINALSTQSDWSEQRGFGSLVKGMFGTFRNPTAHEPRSEWEMSEEDALDLLVMASYAHRRLDRAKRR